MFSISISRKLGAAVALALAFGTVACSSDSIVGADSSDAMLAKNGGAGGGGNAHWLEDQTGYDPTTHTFYFKAAGLGKNQSFTILVAASVTTTYDCLNPGAGLHIPKAFQGVQETITGQGTFLATKNGQVAGSIQLDLESQGELRCPPPQGSPEPILPGWQAINVEIESVGGVGVHVTPAYLPARYY